VWLAGWQVIRLNSTTPPEMPYKLFCLIPSSKSVFPVDIDENQTVGDLKDEIKKKQKPELDTMAAAALRLYKIKVDISNDDDVENILDSISMRGYVFTPPKKLLNSSRKISYYFNNDSEMALEVLVELPSGEPINSRARDVVTWLLSRAEKE